MKKVLFLCCIFLGLGLSSCHQNNVVEEPTQSESSVSVTSDSLATSQIDVDISYELSNSSNEEIAQVPEGNFFTKGTEVMIKTPMTLTTRAIKRRILNEYGYIKFSDQVRLFTRNNYC